jgi:tight adherence protein C
MRVRDVERSFLFYNTEGRLMGSDLLPMVLILVTGVAAYFFVSALMARDEGASALSWASGNAPSKSKSSLIEMSRPLVHQFTIQYAVKIKDPKWRAKIQKSLITSGLTSELNVDEFLGLKLLWGVALPIIAVVLNFALQLNYPAGIFLVIGLVGWKMPDSHANGMRGTRQRKIVNELPFFTDLMALAVEAGKDFQGAIQAIVEKSSKDSVLADELNQVLRDITLGSSRADALKALATRCDLQQINSLVNVIIDSDATGVSISKVLKDQSAQMRLERFVRAEKAGAQASQKILIPLVLFILPAVFIMVFAPVALQFIYGSK